MDNFIKIIIIGYGSIGQRHYKNLIRLGFKNVFIYDIDEQKTINLKTIDILNKNNLKNFDVAFICNPTNLHIKTATLCAHAGCHLFIEKPLSHNLKDIDKLIKICHDKQIVNIVACNLRFDPAIKKIKKLLDKKFLGKLYAIYFEYGRHLPYQRQDVDYRKIYAANKKMGGGIILDDIHEFDLLFWFNNFSKIKKSNFIFDTASDLEINVEDICNATFQFENGVIGSVRCDYLQQYKHRNFKIIGEKGNLVWNFRENIVWFEYFTNNSEEKREKIFVPEIFDENSAYLNEIKYFLSCVDRKQNNFNNIETALNILKPIINR